MNTIAVCGSKFGFRAPVAKRIDDVTIEMNFVETSQSSSSVFRSHVCCRSFENEDACGELVRKSGRALAAIHRCLSEAVQCSTESQELADGQSVLHCDFGFSNIFLNADSELVIFDPFPDYYSTFETWEIGPRSRDLGMFVSCLIGRVPLTDFFRLRLERIPKLIEAFVVNYNQNSDEAVCLNEVLAESSKIAKSYFSQNTRGVKRQLGARLWSRNLESILKRLELK